MLDRIASNWPLKLLALAIAYYIWASVSGESRIVKDYGVPLEVKLPEDRILTVAPPTTVTVRLRAVESLMRRLESVPMEVRVSLDNAELGARDVQLAKSDVLNVPRGADVEFVDPDRISLHVEERARRELPVEPTFLGQPPDGFAFYGARVRPERQFVDGPVSEIQALELLRTNPIRLDQHREPFVVRISAVPEGPHVRVVDPQPVEVHIDVDAAPVERRIEGVEIAVIGNENRVKLSQEKVDVTLSGPPSLVDWVLADQIRPRVDITALEPTGRPQRVEVSIELVGLPPEDLSRVTVKTVSKRRISATVTKAEDPQ